MHRGIRSRSTDFIEVNKINNPRNSKWPLKSEQLSVEHTDGVLRAKASNSDHADKDVVRN
jgi:hypothetical protein